MSEAGREQAHQEGNLSTGCTAGPVPCEFCGEGREQVVECSHLAPCTPTYRCSMHRPGRDQMACCAHCEGRQRPCTWNGQHEDPCHACARTWWCGRCQALVPADHAESAAAREH